jgi:Zn-finger nucleic acid-binding protein
LPTDRIKPASKTLEAIEEDLKKWFKEKWVRFGPDGKIRGDCARGNKGEGKPKCLPQSKAHALGKAGRASAATKKRREDPNPERRGAAKNVATKVREGIPFDQCPSCGGSIVHESQLEEKQDACYHKVRSRYKVWPSAYASGALVQCRKKGAANWGNKSKK